MKEKQTFAEIFDLLKPVLQSYAADLTVVSDKPTSYYLDTQFIMKNNKLQFFGSVRIAKNYVSFHLMPVYVHPELLDDISPTLKKRMQGKSCFNFKALDDELLAEVTGLAQRCMDSYVADGVVTPS